MAGGGALAALLGKALGGRDPLALRIARNLAERCAPADAVAAFAPAADALADLLVARAPRTKPWNRQVRAACHAILCWPTCSWRATPLRGHEAVRSALPAMRSCAGR